MKLADSERKKAEVGVRSIKCVSKTPQARSLVNFAVVRGGQGSGASSLTLCWLHCECSQLCFTNKT